MALSPSFSLQHIIDRVGDIFLFNPDPNYRGGYLEGECFPESTAYLYSDIAQVDYISDGSILNTTAWMSPSFERTVRDPDVYIYLPHNQSQIVTRNQSLDDKLLNEYLEVVLKEYATGGKNVIQYSANSSLAGNRAFDIFANYSAPSPSGNKTINEYAIGTIINGRPYAIAYRIHGPGFPYMSEVQHMIDSFEIHGASDVSRNVTTDNPNFSTYQNSTLGIKIDYPSRWLWSPPINNTIHIEANPKENVSTQDRISALRYKQIEMVFNVLSEYENIYNLDYDLVVKWDPVNQSWISTLYQGNPVGPWKILVQKDNSSGFFKINEHYFDLSLDLKDLNYPKNYSAAILIADKLNNSKAFCQVADFTSLALFPVPKTSTSISPSSLSLRPGEEGTVQLKIKSDISRDSVVELHAKSVHNIELSFNPSNFSLPSFSEADSTLKIKAPSDFTTQGNHLVNINQTLSFAPTLFGFSSPIVEKTKIAPSSTNKIIPVTVTLLPPLTVEERLNNFAQLWITPLGAIWTFLFGVAAVVSPLVIRMYRSRRRGTGPTN